MLMCLVIGDIRPTISLVANEMLRQQLRALTGAERRLVEAVLIHKHRARSSPRVIPGPSQFVALFLREQTLGILRRSSTAF